MVGVAVECCELGCDARMASWCQCRYEDVDDLPVVIGGECDWHYDCLVHLLSRIAYNGESGGTNIYRGGNDHCGSNEELRWIVA